MDTNHFPSLIGIDLEQIKDNYEMLSLDLEISLDRTEAFTFFLKIFFAGWRSLAQMMLE